MSVCCSTLGPREVERSSPAAGINTSSSSVVMLAAAGAAFSCKGSSNHVKHRGEPDSFAVHCSSMATVAVEYTKMHS